jgi:hypothetical protein
MDRPARQLRHSIIRLSMPKTFGSRTPELQPWKLKNKQFATIGWGFIVMVRADQNMIEMGSDEATLDAISLKCASFRDLLLRFVLLQSVFRFSRQSRHLANNRSRKLSDSMLTLVALCGRCDLF